VSHPFFPNPSGYPRHSPCCFSPLFTAAPRPSLFQSDPGVFLLTMVSPLPFLSYHAQYCPPPPNHLFFNNKFLKDNTSWTSRNRGFCFLSLISCVLRSKRDLRFPPLHIFALFSYMDHSAPLPSVLPKCFLFAPSQELLSFSLFIIGTGAFNTQIANSICDGRPVPRLPKFFPSFQWLCCGNMVFEY